MIGVLEQILSIQKLDEHDIEGVAPLYDLLLLRYKAAPSPPASSGELALPRMSFQRRNLNEV